MSKRTYEAKDYLIVRIVHEQEPPKIHLVDDWKVKADRYNALIALAKSDPNVILAVSPENTIVTFMAKPSAQQKYEELCSIKSYILGKVDTITVGEE